MAVYTVLDTNDIVSILRKYDLGTLQRFEAISSGIENTNYFLWLKSNDQIITQWVLTIFENLSESSLPFFNNLTIHLSQKGLAVPAPERMSNGQYVFSILQTSQRHANKFGVLVPKFEGASIDFPDEQACQRVAVFTAEMHNALSDFPDANNIQHSFNWCKQLVGELSPLIPEEDLQALNLALTRYQAYQALIDECPAGVVHGDLFRDNVLFENGKISGVIDFYNAGKTAFLFDLAVIANDWAVNFEYLPSLFSSKGGDIKGLELKNIYDKPKLDALLSAYESVRPFSDIEKTLWPRLMELAAFRFYLSRLKTKYTKGYQQEAKEGEVIKSPDAMKIIMLAAMER
jgi:homoserine kinase type II